MIRARSREIQTFNLSMMDVVSGAMGAFLIIMVILARYYEADPGNAVAAAQLEAELERVRERLAEAERRAQSAGIHEDLREPLRDARAGLDRTRQQVGLLQRELDEADAALRRLRQQVPELEQQARQLRSDLTMREPLLIRVLPRGERPAKFDIYVHDPRPDSGGKTQPPFDPRRRQSIHFRGDYILADPSGAATWMIRDVPKGSELRVYVRRADEQTPPAPAPYEVLVHITSTGRTVALGGGTLAPSERGGFAAVVSRAADGAVTVRRPSSEELDRFQRELADRLARPG